MEDFCKRRIEELCVDREYHKAYLTVIRIITDSTREEKINFIRQQAQQAFSDYLGTISGIKIINTAQTITGLKKYRKDYVSAQMKDNKLEAESAILGARQSALDHLQELAVEKLTKLAQDFFLHHDLHELVRLEEASISN